MAIRQIAQLKQWFKKGAYPKEYQFADWMDSYWHKEDEQIPTDVVEGLNDVLNSKYDLERGEVLEERVTITEERLNEHDEHLEMHDKHLKRHDDHLTEHDEHLSEHDDRLDDHDQQLKGHDQHLQKHDEHLQKHDEHLDKHDKHLSNHDDRLDDHDQQLKGHDKYLQKHDEHLDKHDKQLSDHVNRLDDHDGQLKEHEDSLKNHTEQITQNEENIATLQKGTLQTVSISGTGNAVTHIEEKENNVLAIEKGNTFVDIGSNQMITGFKAFTDRMAIGGTAGEARYSLVVTGMTYCQGALSTEGNILSYANITSRNNLFVGNKTSSTDGNPGVVANSLGYIEISSTGSPFINFHRENSTAGYTSRIIEVASGILAIPHRLKVGSTIVQDTDETFTVSGSTYLDGTLTTKTIYSSSDIYTGGKTNSHDGKPGTYIGIAGNIEISGSTPYIDFHHNNSIADYTSRIIEAYSGTLSIPGKLTIGSISNPSYTLYSSGTLGIGGIVYGGGAIFSHGKTDINDGKAGISLGQGALAITGGSYCEIRFQYNGSTSNYTSKIAEIENGVLSIPGRLTLGGTTNESNQSLYVQGNTKVSGSLQAGNYIGLPIATTDIQGIASYNKDHFTVQDGKVSLNTTAKEKSTIGIISIWSGSATNLPENHILCDGRALNKADYPELYQIVGDLHKTTATSTQFNVPDLTGRFVAGYKNGDTDHGGVARQGGSKTVSLTVANLPSHVHSFQDYYYVENLATGGYSGNEKLSKSYAGSAYTDYDNTYMFYRTHDIYSTGSGTAHQNLPPYYTLAYIIRVK